MTVRVCAADGCFRPARRRWCGDRCRKRQFERDQNGSFPERWCTHCGTYLGRVYRNRRFCDWRCGWWHRDGVPAEEPELSPYWREYLARFDRALRERTGDAWAAAHEMAPVSTSQPHFYQPDVARLLRTLEG